MSNTILEELEIEELSKKLMLKLSPRILEERPDEDLVDPMIIDDDNNNSIKDSLLNFESKMSTEYNEKKTDLNNSEFIKLNQNQKLNNIKEKSNLKMDYNLLNNTQLYRSNSLPPLNKDNYCKGLNLFKKREIKAINNNYNKEKYNFNEFSYDLNRKIYSNSLKKLNIENSHEFIRLIFNIVIIFITLYIIFGIIFVIKNDIESKIQISISNILDEMNICSKYYVENKCQPELRVPAMESKCTEWEKCMSQNPTIIARKSIFTAQIIGEIINTFFDQISFKSALLIFGFIIALIIGNYLALSSAFSFNKNYPHTKNYLESTSIIQKK